MHITILVAAMVASQEPASQTSHPVVIVEAAQAAVAADRSDVLRAEWESLLRDDARDPNALLGLGTLARLNYDYPTSDALFRQLLDSDAEPDFRIQALLGLTRVRLIAGDLLSADSLVLLADTIATATHDTIGLTRTLFLRTAYVRRTRGLEAEMAALMRLDTVIPNGANADRAEWRCRQGSQLVFVAAPGAGQTIRAGLETARALHDVAVEALCLKTLGEYAVAQGEVDSAIVWMGQAARLLQAQRDDIAAAAVLQWRGYTNLEAGYYGQALEDLVAAVRHAERSASAPSEAWAHLNLARIALHLGDVEGGIYSTTRARTILERMGDTWGLAVARRLQGHLAVKGQAWAEADSLYRDVLQWAEANGIASEQVSLHRELARVAVERRDWTTVNKELAAGRRVARTAGLTAAAEGLAYVEGVSLLRQGRARAAAAAFRRYELALGPEQHAHRYTARARRAEALVALGQLEQAEREMVEAGGELDRFRASLTDRDMRRFVFQTSVDPYSTDLGVATVINALAHDGRLETAFALVEQRRARDLASRLVRAAEIEDPETSVTASTVNIPGLAEVQASLTDDETAFVEYVVGSGGQPATAFVVTSDEMSSVSLEPQTEIAGEIARFVALLEQGAGAEGLARKLAKALWDPVAAGLPPSVERVVIVPDGALHRLPFGALKLPSGAWLVERYQTSLVPSAAVAVHLRASPVSAGADVLAFGNPQLSAAPGGTSVSAWGMPTAELPALPFSGAEARMAAGYATGDGAALTGRAASEAELKRAAVRPYSVVHFATHAIVDEVAVNRAALYLSPGDGEDGLVTSSELAALTLPTDLVVLSACRTAGGVVIAGEGMQGLTAPLLEAGARSIVASRWPIGDRATLRLMRSFYRAMADGRTVGVAMQSATLQLIAEGAPTGEWASFAVIGDAQARPAVSRPPTNTVWLAGTALVLLGAAGYWGWSRRSNGVPRT